MPTAKFQKDACAACGGKLSATMITHEERRGDKFYLFHHVPAQVCDQCGEVWIEEKVLQEIDLLIEKGRPTRTEETPVFDFAPAGSSTKR
jgi:YgiT-type zinc finger domain-containing protein